MSPIQEETGGDEMEEGEVPEVALDSSDTFTESTDDGKKRVKKVKKAPGPTGRCPPAPKVAETQREAWSCLLSQIPSLFLHIVYMQSPILSQTREFRHSRLKETSHASRREVCGS